MTQSPASCRIGFPTPDDYRQVREVLARAQFTDGGILESLGEDARSLSSRDQALLRHQTRQPTPLNSLIRLFLMGVPVELEAARHAVAPMNVAAWGEAGLLQVNGSRVTATVQLVPFCQLLVAFDFARRIASDRAADYVMGIGSSTTTLANLTIRQPITAALDLGTGCGIHALLAAAHSERVLGTDCNARALVLAAFNAQLNDIANVECRCGSLFEPVAGQRFDLIVSNPPFVVSPETHYIYRDSGRKGDEFVRQIVRTVPPHLAEGGFCQILCNWAHTAGQDWESRLTDWFTETGCDVWVMRSDTLEAPAYAAKWIRHTERDGEPQLEDRFDQWLRYYEREGIEAVSGGLITMRRRGSGQGWFRTSDAPPRMMGPAGESLLRSFRLHDFLLAHPDDASLLDCRLQLCPDARFQQHYQPSAAGWSPLSTELYLERGLAYSGGADPYVVRLLGLLNGERSLRTAVAELASCLALEVDSIEQPCAAIVRRLIGQGFLLPVAGSQE